MGNILAGEGVIRDGDAVIRTCEGMISAGQIF